MRRYTLNINDREFIADVQEIDGDNFEVQVGGETYAVNLVGDESLGVTAVTPGLAATTASAAPARRAAPRPAPAASSAPAAAPAASAPRKPAGGGGKGTQSAPMPGVILEVNVKAGDAVTRGQQLAVLDAMKMHNAIGAQKDGTIEEVYVAAGQSVDHGTPLFKFKE